MDSRAHFGRALAGWAKAAMAGLLALWAVVAPAAAPPGGKGMLATPSCLATGHATVPWICVRAQLHYEFSALMGEPTVHYGLNWELVSITPGRTAAPLYAGTPAFDRVFGPAARGLSLMAQGHARLRGAKGEPARSLAFDTGAPTRAGRMSWDVAGSPDWGQLLFAPPSCAELAAGQLRRAPVAEAKATWARGDVAITDLTICPKGTAFDGVAELAAAVDAFCKRHSDGEGLVPCAQAPKTPEESARTNALDDSFDSLGDKQRLARLRAEFDASTRSRCESRWQAVQRCKSETAGCQPRTSQETAACVKARCGYEPQKMECPVEKVDAPCNHGAGSLCLRLRTCPQAEVVTAAYQRWSQCSAAAGECRVDASCAARCNPEGLASVDECIARQQRDAPTMQQARQAERVRRNAADPTKSDRNGDRKTDTPPPKNYLD